MAQPGPGWPACIRMVKWTETFHLEPHYFYRVIVTMLHEPEHDITFVFAYNVLAREDIFSIPRQTIRHFVLQIRANQP